MVGCPVQNAGPNQKSAAKTAARLALLALICLLAGVANFFVDILLSVALQLPIFADTIFTIAVAFALGPIPAIATLALSWLIGVAFVGNVNPFIFVAIAEALLVCLLKPADCDAQPASPEIKSAYIANTFARLMLIYIVCVAAVSVLGGAIDFLHHSVAGAERTYFLAIDAFRLNFMASGIHELAASIFSRIIVNMVSRIVIIFGGYFASRLLALAWKKAGMRAGGAEPAE